MKQTMSQRQKCKFQLEHNGIVYDLGEMNSNNAMKKAHQYVRRWVMKEWMRTHYPNETTVSVMADGREYSRVYGQHKNRYVQSFTL